MVRENLFRSKKGISFFLLLAIISVLLFGLFLVGFLNPVKDAIFDSEFKTTEVVDNLAYLETVDLVYMEVLLKNSFSKFKEDYFKEFEIVGRLQGTQIFEKKFVSCSFEGDLILYNEAYLDYQVNSDWYKKDNSMKLNSCFPDFKDDFLGEFVSFVDKKLMKNIETYFSNSLGTFSNLDVSLNEDNNVAIDVDFEYLGNIDKGEIKLKNSVNSVYEVGHFEDLVLTLKRVLPKFSEAVKNDILICKKDKSINVVDKDLFCISKSFEKLVSEDNSGLGKVFDFELSRVVNGDVENFYGVKINVIDKVSKDVELSFITVLENNLPFGQVDFEVSSYDGFDNVFDLDIAKPNLNGSDLRGMIILYSYENFLDKGNYRSYDKLINLLETSKIPDGFKSQGVSSTYGEFRGSDKDSEMDLSLLYVKKLNFDKNNNLNIKVHQIFNEDTQEFELIKMGRQVHFVVFAVGSKFNYFTDEGLLREVFKSGISKKVLGPVPITKSQFKIKGDIIDVDRSIEVELLDYPVEGISNFELFITKNKSGPLVPNCVSVEYFCKSFSIPISSDKNRKFLVTQSSSLSSDILANYENIFDLAEFGLGDGEDVEIFLIPVNNDEIGIYNKFLLNVGVKKVSNYFAFEEKGDHPMDVISFSTKIVDRKAPGFNEFKFLDSSPLRFVSEFNQLVLSWTKLDSNSDVNSLYVKFESFDASGAFLGFIVKKVGLDGKTNFVPKPEASMVVVKKIAPEDVSGNSLYTSGSSINGVPDVTSSVVWSR